MATSHHNSAEAAAAIWDPSGSRPLLDAGQLRDRARRRGALRGLIGVAAGAALIHAGLTLVGSVALAIGGITLAAAIVSPAGAYVRIEWAMRELGEGVARVHSWVLLAPVYFLFFLPFGMVLRRGRADTLRRWYDAALPSYWTARGDAPPDYRRPF